MLHPMEYFRRFGMISQAIGELDKMEYLEYLIVRKQVAIVADYRKSKVTLLHLWIELSISTATIFIS